MQTNLESQRRQYDLVEEARRRGFLQVEVIDDDLGRSASGMVARPGFDRLVAWLCAGEVGAVLCSRDRSGWRLPPVSPHRQRLIATTIQQLRVTANDNDNGYGIMWSGYGNWKAVATKTRIPCSHKRKKLKNFRSQALNFIRQFAL